MVSWGLVCPASPLLVTRAWLAERVAWVSDRHAYGNVVRRAYGHAFLRRASVSRVVHGTALLGGYLYGVSRIHLIYACFCVFA